MEPTYDPRGKVIAWLNGENIYYLNGKHAAVLNGENLYGRRGQHLGVFLSGFFGDHRGGAVAFMEGASGGPLLPLASLPPLPPLPALAPLPAVPSLPPLPGLPSLRWSQVVWAQFTTASAQP